MATTAITTTSTAKIWVLACSENEQCQIEVLKHNISFVESELQPPTDPKETNSMYFLQNIPRDFQGDGVEKLWVYIDNKDIVRKRPYTPMRLHDAEGNPLSSYYDANTDSWVLNVHDADVHNVPVNQYFHQHTGLVTTLTTATSADGTTYIIDVVDTTGFIIGQYLQIGAENHQSIKPQILALTATTMTLDSYIDFEAPIGTAIIEASVQMNVLGTLATPSEFIIRPNPGQVIHITRIIITMTHNTLGDDGLFGDLNPLINGVLLRANVNNQYGTYTNWKTNEKIAGDMYDLRYTIRSSGGGTYGTVGRGSFSRIDVALRLDGRNGAVDGDFLEIYIRDDLTGLLSFEIKAQGHVEGA